MHLDRRRSGGVDFFLRTPRLAQPSGCPASQQAESVPCALLLRQSGFGVLPQLLGFGELADGGIEFAEDLFGFGVDPIALGVCEVFAVFLVEVGCG